MHKIRKKHNCVKVSSQLQTSKRTDQKHTPKKLLVSPEARKRCVANPNPPTTQTQNDKKPRVHCAAQNPDPIGLSISPNLNARKSQESSGIPTQYRLELDFDERKKRKKADFWGFDTVASERKSWAIRATRRLANEDMKFDVRFHMKIAKNGEGKCYISEKKKPKQKKIFFEKNSPPKRKEGNLVQKGLTKHAKRTIRIVSDCYNDVISKSDEFNDYSRFVTLTYRNIIPTDQEAKKHLNAFFQRIRRMKPNAHYVWVAEVQTEREKRTGERAIHFHILTPEKLHKPEDGDDLYSVKNKERLWLNRTWNEIVAKDSFKKEKITKEEYETWMLELDHNEGYNQRLHGYRNGTRKRKPVKPKSSTHLLLPNLEMVYYAGRYMAKYMSKEGQNIIGNMWNCSRESRKLLKPASEVNLGLRTYLDAAEISDFIEKQMKRERRFLAVYRIEYNDTPLLWSNEGWSMLEHYYSYVEMKRLEEQRKENTRRRKRRKILVENARQQVLINSG